MLIPLWLKASASVTDATTQKKIHRSGTTALISNEETQDKIKIVKSFEESELLIEDISETIKNEGEEQKGGFLGTLLGTLAASLLRSALTGWGVIRPGKGAIRAGENVQCCLIL